MFAIWQPVETTIGLIERAWHWTDEARLSYWDSLILAAAERAGCNWLLSEDFQPGRRLGDVTVVSPFGADPAEFDLPGIRRN
jgi:predicted nucleic acid-binding protein